MRIIAAIVLLAAMFLFGHPAAAQTEHAFSNVLFHFCHNGNVCRFSIPDLHPLLGEAVNVRIRGVESPRLWGSCDAEKTHGERAKAVINGLLAEAERIDLVAVTRGSYFRLIADVIADGVSIGPVLIQRGLARVYYEDGTRSDWCAWDHLAYGSHPPAGRSPD